MADRRRLIVVLVAGFSVAAVCAVLLALSFASVRSVPRHVPATSYVDLPGIDLSGLTAQQRNAVITRSNHEICPCDHCEHTVAQCRYEHRDCGPSREVIAGIIGAVRQQTEGK